jgi:hypothetical protein
MVIELREEQPEKALSPIEVTDEGMSKVIEVREAQSEKALSPIEMTEEGMVKAPALPPGHAIS